MSDLKYQTPTELVKRLVSTTGYIEQLQAELDEHEANAQRTRQKIGGQLERRKWIIHYLSGKTSDDPIEQEMF